jgi:hypothetical protein
LGLESLELPLSFEVGHLTLTLSQIETLVPGAVVPFPADPQGPVSVICHGQRLAKGFLVDLGQGLLGVQLTEVGLKDRAMAKATDGPGQLAPKSSSEADELLLPEQAGDFA